MLGPEFLDRIDRVLAAANRGGASPAHPLLDLHSGDVIGPDSGSPIYPDLHNQAAANRARAERLMQSGKMAAATGGRSFVTHDFAAHVVGIAEDISPGVNFSSETLTFGKNVAAALQSVGATSPGPSEPRIREAIARALASGGVFPDADVAQWPDLRSKNILNKLARQKAESVGDLGIGFVAGGSAIFSSEDVLLGAAIMAAESRR